MVHLDGRPCHHPDVVDQVVMDQALNEEQAILVLPGLGQAKVLNAVGARIWQLADGNRTVGQIAEVISVEFQVGLEEAQGDTQAFIRQLVERQVLVLAGMV